MKNQVRMGPTTTSFFRTKREHEVKGIFPKEAARNIQPQKSVHVVQSSKPRTVHIVKAETPPTPFVDPKLGTLYITATGQKVYLKGGLKKGSVCVDEKGNEMRNQNITLDDGTKFSTDANAKVSSITERKQAKARATVNRVEIFKAQLKQEKLKQLKNK
ncbi:MAG: hypothetical protein EHM20_01495 [Alphaproteobacteria bacterium]|nr:MAG: hypothetical protein EHM20_01495 [Alphaproteobacteria bacterium]